MPLKRITKYQIPSGPLPSYLFDVTQYKAPEKYTDTIEPAVITAILPEKFHGSQAAAARYAAGQKWGKENVAEPRDKFAQEYVLPAMGAAAFGVPGLVGAGGGFAVDATINALTNGNKNSFGDLFVDPEKYPILNTAVNFFNPGYYLGGLAVTKPLVQTVSSRTAVALGLEKEYLKNEIKALNQNIRNWTRNKTLERNILAGKLGWTPSQTKTLWHASNEPVSELKITYPAWDVTERNAPLGHVWLSDSKVKSGFLNDRPYHKFDKVELKKPMIQIGEAIGDGKNNTRNQILDFAQKSSADALEFNNIADNTLQHQNVYAIFKDVPLRRLKVNISEAERLGIPKGERNQPAPKNPIQVTLVNRGDEYVPVEDGMFTFESPEKAKKLASIHFTQHTPVTAHGGGNWDSKSTTLLLPYGNMRKATYPLNLDIMDTFFPNYNGLKVKTNGAKVLTSDKNIYDYYKSRGVDVEFSEEAAKLREQYDVLYDKFNKYMKAHKWWPDDYSNNLSNQIDDLGSKIGNIHETFVEQNRIQPSVSGLKRLEKIEGLPIRIEEVGDIATPIERKLGFTYHSTPTIHSSLIEMTPESYYYNELPWQQREFVDWINKHKADYRKQGGILKNK